MKELKDGISFKGIDRQRLRMFFLSILWRSSVSWHESYGNIDLPTELESQLRDALATDTKLPASVLNVAVYKLKDSSPPNGFSDEHIRSLVVAPFARKFTNFISVCFLFYGFMTEIFIPKLPKQFKNRLGILSGSSPAFLAPYYEIMEIPEIKKMLVGALKKHSGGLSQVP